ncbi:VWA domain-containing protein [Anabaena cylindrica FACHB-243]|uniref:von Willebrand factor type A n=1 Tax=Anabaena cylindrica (strain ATCC 27899 / PCC 7122) TaxID=272123 RepID=K9ZN90_ANACC|nr:MULTISPECIES: VWA domain-containing protein [Anabaena]AFZ60688.1 von Willebrand factor type A [Anabaena cylindrica PCC 7122]MBD2419530.1 VWA domain-containing protein [Anabaena cylindrica FACHB-243]MBY5282211.1 VWA domain-containing protein [Anabaena sp. CCAP 1446/1C]MBY5309109.1 VWA domain-containing protein [Anabaena sp. CCAP 1446/1C]MCM2409724.1 VWA domain-containing protein [Anabaena sp. CCAP 1446/1C]
MKVNLQPTLNDANLDANQASSQRQLAVSISAVGETLDRSVSLNLCLILDHSGSMRGRSLETVKKAASLLVDRLSADDRLSIVAFDHRAKVLVPNQVITDREQIKQQINRLSADGGTAIDEGLRVGIEELAKGKKETVSHAFLLTDGENEHGDNDRCLKFAQLAASYNLTLNTLGFGDNWNQDILEKIADAGLGNLSHIEQPDQAMDKFSRLFTRMQTVGLTNAYLLFSLMPNVRLAELKPVAQVAPDTIELPVQPDADGRFLVRLGDLMKDVERVILANIYLGQLPEGKQAIANVQVRYDDPAQNQTGLFSLNMPVYANVGRIYQPSANPEVQQSILALAKYRQTQLAEAKLQQGDRAGAATMLQTAAKTALQMGDASGATVLQTNATRLQAGEELSESDRKKTRIVSKTVLQDAPPK